MTLFLSSKKIALLLIFSLAAMTVFPVYRVQAATGKTYDLATQTNYNLRFDGGPTDLWLSDQTLVAADFNADGKNDLLIGSDVGSNGGQSFGGSAYVIYNDILVAHSGKANNLDLNNPSNYNLRFDGAASDTLGFRRPALGDIDGDGKIDFVFTAKSAANNGRSGSGSVYVIFNTILQHYSGTGNNVSLSTSTNYNIRYDGVSTNDALGAGGVALGDVNGNGRVDLLLGANGTDYNSRGDSGSVYLVRDSLLNSYTNTGNNVDLTTTSNWNVRYDGSAANAALGEQAVQMGDLDSNGKADLVLGADGEAKNGRTDSGSAYIIYDSLVGAIAGTGNTVDLNTGGNYNIRYDGGSATEFLSVGAALPTDLDNDGKLDLVLGAVGADYNSRTGSGSFYILYNSLIATQAGTGNNVDLATGTNYNVRYDGPAAGSNIARLQLQVSDIDGDGKTDLLVPSFDDQNSRNNSGSLYLIYNTLFGAYSGTDNRVDMSNNTTWNVRYDGAGAGDSFTEASITAADFNGDGSNDIASGAYLADNNSRSDSGSTYVIFTFPHSISTSSLASYVNSLVQTITGTISASNAVSSISDIQWSVDTTSFSGTWTSCSSTDGSFNSNSEAYSCSITLPSSNGSHTIRIRALDSNGSYTFTSHQPALSTILDRTSPSTTVLSVDPTYSNRATISGTISDATSGVASLMVDGSSVTLGGDGSFTTTLTVPSSTTVTLVATDRAGNSTTNVIDVTRRYHGVFSAGDTYTFHPVWSNPIVYRSSEVLDALKFGRGYRTKDNAIIKTFQQVLKDLGYFTVEPTGNFGPKTRSAVSAFQAAKNLKVTGSVDVRTLSMLSDLSLSDERVVQPLTKNKWGFTKSMLQEGANAQIIETPRPNRQSIQTRFLQQKLYFLGYYTGPMHGWFNASTQAAVRSLRRAKGYTILTATLVDSTFRALLNSL